MNYRTVGVLAGYRGRRVASQWGALLRVPQAKKPLRIQNTMNWGTYMKCSGASSHETFMNSKHHELGNLHEIGDPNLHGISQPKGGASGFGENL